MINVKTPESATESLDPAITTQCERTRDKIGNTIGAGIGIMGSATQIGGYAVARLANETWETGVKILRGAKGKPFQETAA